MPLQLQSLGTDSNSVRVIDSLSTVVKLMSCSVVVLGPLLLGATAGLSSVPSVEAIRTNQKLSILEQVNATMQHLNSKGLDLWELQKQAEAAAKEQGLNRTKFREETLKYSLNQLQSKQLPLLPSLDYPRGANPYSVVQKLGSGANGSVYLVHDHATAENVVLKFCTHGCLGEHVAVSQAQHGTQSPAGFWDRHTLKDHGILMMPNPADNKPTVAFVMGTGQYTLKGLVEARKEDPNILTKEDWIKQVKGIKKQLKNKNNRWADCHEGNVMYNVENGKVVVKLIDWDGNVMRKGQRRWCFNNLFGKFLSKQLFGEEIKEISAKSKKSKSNA